MALVDELRAWRTAVVEHRRRESGKSLPAFLVATDAVLIAIAREQPRDLAALGRIKGIQRALVAERGAELLAIVAGKPVAGSGGSA